MPSNFPRTWSGKALSGSMSGFTEYSTERVEPATQPAPILSPDDLVASIREMRSILDLNQIAVMITTLENHIADTNNPHQTTLSQFPDDVIDVLYQAYLDNQGTGTKDEFTSALFATIRIASSAEIKDPDTYGGLLISVKQAYQLIKEHEADPAAHAGLFNEMFPGSPISDVPVEALYPYVGIGQSYVFNPTFSSAEFPESAVVDNGTSYVDPCGIVRYLSASEGIHSDYTYGRALFPCFSARCNYFIHSTNLLLAPGTTFAGSLEETTVKAPDDSLSAVAFRSNRDTIAVTHGYKIGTFALTPRTAKTVSIHVKAGACDLVELAGICSADDVINSSLIIDLKTGNYVFTNPLSNVRADIAKMGNGWFRICISVAPKDIYTYAFTVTFFKKNSEDLASVTKAYISDHEICGYLWGVQVENGFSMSPLIATNNSEVYRKPSALSIVPNGWNTNDWTIYVAVKRPLGSSDTDRPIFSVLNSNSKTVTDCYYKTDDTVQLKRWINSSGNDSITAETMTETFNVSNKDYDQIVYSANSDGTITKYNNTDGLNLSYPVMIDAGAEIRIGADRNGNCLDGFISGVLIYGRKATEEEVDFLSGEEL